MHAPSQHIRLFIGALLLFFAGLFSAKVYAQLSDNIAESKVSAPSILLLENENTHPSIFEVSDKLLPKMEKIGVRVRVDAAKQFPANQTDWSNYSAKKAKEIPGLLAVFSWYCPGVDECYIYLVEPQSLALSSIPVGDGWRNAPGEKSIESRGDLAGTVNVATATNIAAGISAAIYGELLFELPIISAQANHPQTEDMTKKIMETRPEETKVEVITTEPFVPPVLNHGERKLWLEAGYIGAYPYPSNGTIHGIFLGATLYLKKHFAPAIRVGGMAWRSQSGENGSVDAYNFPIGLHFKFPMNLGPAIFSIAPVVQWDMVLVRKNPNVDSGTTNFQSDVSFGGETSWNVPMPKSDIELFFGAGILATVLSEAYSISGEVIMDDTRLQFYWLAGISKNIYIK